MNKMTLPPNWRVVRIEGDYALVVRVDGLTCYVPVALYDNIPQKPAEAKTICRFKAGDLSDAEWVALGSRGCFLQIR
jgi:hypothetical protein